MNAQWGVDFPRPNRVILRRAWKRPPLEDKPLATLDLCDSSDFPCRFSLASLQDAGHSGIASGGVASGGVALLNHRLMAWIPPASRLERLLSNLAIWNLELFDFQQFYDEMQRRATRNRRVPFLAVAELVGDF
jgi:hypothetical protein